VLPQKEVTPTSKEIKRIDEKITDLELHFMDRKENETNERKREREV